MAYTFRDVAHWLKPTRTKLHEEHRSASGGRAAALRVTAGGQARRKRALNGPGSIFRAAWRRLSLALMATIRLVISWPAVVRFKFIPQASP